MIRLVLTISAALAVTLAARPAYAPFDIDPKDIPPGTVFIEAYADQRIAALVAYSSARGDNEGARRAIDVLDSHRDATAFWSVHPDNIERVTKLAFGVYVGDPVPGDVVFRLDLQSGRPLYVVGMWPEPLPPREPDATVCIMPGDLGPVTFDGSSPTCRRLIASMERRALD